MAWGLRICGALCLGIFDSGGLDSELEDLQFGKQGYHFGFKCLGFLCFEDYGDIGLSYNSGYLFGGPCKKDYSLLGFMLGSPYLGKLPYGSVGFGVSRLRVSGGV